MVCELLPPILQAEIEEPRRGQSDEGVLCPRNAGTSGSSAVIGSRVKTTTTSADLRDAGSSSFVESHPRGPAKAGRPRGGGRKREECRRQPRSEPLRR